jgi:Phosphodiester glycosidase
MLHRRSRGRRPARAAVLAVLAGAAVAVASLSPVAVSATVTAARAKETYHPRRGLTLTSVRYAGGPVEVRVLEFTPKPKRRGYTVEPGINGPVISSHATPSSIATSVGGVAAINGDFALDGQPAHFNAVDGDVRTSGIINGSGFAISKDERFAWADHTDAVISAEASNGTSFRVDHWNADDRDGPGGPVLGEITAYTKDGGTKQAPDEDSCAVRLINPSGRRWANDDRSALTRTWEIGQRVCQHSALAIGSEPGNVVLNSRETGVGADALKALPTNGTVTISWRLAGWPGVVEAVGGQPVIVDRGVNVGPPPTTGSSYFYKPNPRTAIGITQGCSDSNATTVCRVIYMVVDGRQAGWSVGMTLKELGAEMLKFGAYYAVNLDGGGGTSMWLANKGPWCITDTNGGCLVDRPADGHERATLTAMLVLQGRDTNEPPIGAASRTTSAWETGFGFPDDDSQNWQRLALTDPGSTGGLLDALAERGRLPTGLQPYLHIYRGGSAP